MTLCVTFWKMILTRRHDGTLFLWFLWSRGTSWSFFFFSISFVKLRSCKNVKRFDGKLLQEKKLNNDGNNFTTFFPWKWLRYAESIQPCFRIIKNSTCANLKYKRGTGHSVEIKRFSVIQILCEINFDKYIVTIFS